MQEGQPFRRGYLFGTEAPPALPDSYRRVASDLFLYVDAATAHATASDGEATVHVIGEPIDPDRPEDGMREVAATLAAALKTGVDRFLEVSYRLVGRYLLVYRAGARAPRIFADASGMYMIYRADDGRRAFAASHARLAAMQLGAAQRVPPFPPKWGTAGNWTHFDKVWLHSPSLELCLHDGVSRRIFPSAVAAPASVEDCARLMVDRASAALRGIMARHEVIVSLTAGGDTRATLAVVRRIGADPMFFTYNGGQPRPEIDMAVAKALRQELGIRHKIVSRAKRSELPDTLAAELDASTVMTHGRALVYTYMREFGIDRVVHVRSNVIEFFRVSAVDKTCRKIGVLPDTPENAARVYLSAFMKEWPPQTGAAAAELFRRQFKESDWQEALKHMDSRDLYFVEHRMASWHANLVSESDYAFDTFIIFNSREMFDCARRIPKDVRIRGDLIRRFYELAAPEVLKLPINPDRFPLEPAPAPAAGA